MKNSVSVFIKYANYYDLIYKDKDYLAEAIYLDKLLKKARPKVKKILELGCGTGKHAQILQKYGYKITGIEQSPQMAKKAKNNLDKFILGDIRNFKINEKFDAVLSLFHVISYITDTKELIALFSNIANHLNKKGLFIFDVWYSPCVNRHQPEIKIKKVKNNEIEIFRIAEPENISNLNKVKIKYSIFVKSLKTKKIDMFEEVHEMRHFSIPEIAAIAEQNSFKVLSVKEFLTDKPASINSFGVCFSLEKN